MLESCSKSPSGQYAQPPPWPYHSMWTWDLQKYPRADSTDVLHVGMRDAQFSFSKFFFLSSCSRRRLNIFPEGINMCQEDASKV